MHSERVTFLTTPEGKAAIAMRAAAQGVSIGEFIRRKVEADDAPADRAALEELALLVAEVNRAVPEMRASLERSIEKIQTTRKRVDKMLRDAGIRK